MQVIRQSLKRTSDRQKSYADLHRSFCIFQIEDKVSQGWTPRVVLKMAKCRKLSFRYCGPFRVLRRMGVQSCKLARPPQLQVHDAFHVSCLKVCSRFMTYSRSWWQWTCKSGGVPDGTKAGCEDWEKQLRNRLLWDVSIQWKNCPVEDDSWEDWNKMIAQFSHLQHWFILD